MGATKFGDISKGPKDLLSDDYTTKISLKCKKNAGPVAVTLETEQGKGGALSSKIGTKFSYVGFNVDKAQVKGDGGRVFESSYKPTPNVKLSFKANKGADLGIDYTTSNLYVTGVLDVVEMSKLSSSVCLTLPQGVKVGGDTTYALSGKTGLSSFNVGASYATGPMFASVTTASKMSQFNIGLLYKVNDTVSLASQTTHSSSKPCTLTAIGGAYYAPFGTIKAKTGSNGVVSACLIREIVPKVTVTASGEVSASDLSTFKYGVGITM